MNRLSLFNRSVTPPPNAGPQPHRTVRRAPPRRRAGTAMTPTAVSGGATPAAAATPTVGGRAAGGGTTGSKPNLPTGASSGRSHNRDLGHHAPPAAGTGGFKGLTVVTTDSRPPTGASVSRGAAAPGHIMRAPDDDGSSSSATDDSDSEDERAWRARERRSDHDGGARGAWHGDDDCLESEDDRRDAQRAIIEENAEARSVARAKEGRGLARGSVAAQEKRESD